MDKKIENVLKTEFSKDFVRKMENRMVASFYKYGSLESNCNRKHKEDNTNIIESLEVRLEKYKEDGNTEWLVDVGNFAMIEFMYPQHPKAHFRATDSKESPGVEGLTTGEIKRFKERHG